jgi:type IV secretory pathway TraG/TraD family ATPase VirD4
VVLFLGLLAVLLWLARRETVGRRAQARNRARAMRWRIRLYMRPGLGLASLAELAFRWSRLAAVHHGRRARPGLGFRARLFGRSHQYAVRLGRAQYGKRAFARMEDQILVLAPQRTGKSGLLADRILTHPGAVLATSTRSDLFTLTAGQRARLGPVAVFNPAGVGGVPSTFGWDIISGCADPAVAFRRAEALVGPHTGDGDMAWWQGKASVALGALMHAAALIGADIGDVWAWANRHGEAMAAEALSASRSGASRELAAVFSEMARDGKAADSVRLTMTRSLAWVAVPALRAAVAPPLAAPFDAGRFALARGSLYMIAADGDATAPLFRCFVDHVHHDAALAGSVSPAGKLDPPLLLALDEVTQICPVPLPSMLADSAGKGILIQSVVHGVGQLRERYGENGARTVWATSGTKILLGGIADADTLEDVSALCGTVSVPKGEDMENVPAVPPELIRTLPEWRALVIRMNMNPCVVRFRPVWKRTRYRLGRAATVPVLTPLAPAAAPVLPPAETPAPSLPTLTLGEGNG